MPSFLAIAPDDNELEHLSRLLKELVRNTRVYAAKDPLAAIERVRSEPPDIVILKACSTPISAVIDQIRALRADALFKTLPVFLIAAKDTDSAMQAAAREAGVDHCLIDPVDVFELEERIRAALRLAADERDQRRSSEQEHHGDTNLADLIAVFAHTPSPSALVEAIEASDGQIVGGRFLYANPAFSHLFACERSAFNGGTLDEIVPDTSARWQVLISDAVQTGKMLESEQCFGEFGGYFRVVAFNPRKKIVVFTLLDISNRILAEEHARELRDEAIRTEYWEWTTSLAGGFAHKLNNIMGPILCYADFLLQNMKPESDGFEDAKTIKESAERAIAIVEDLHILGKGGLFKPGAIKLNDLVREYVDGAPMRALRKANPHVDFKLELMRVSPLIRGYAPHLARIAGVLLENAFAAAKPAGVVLLETRLQELERTLKAKPENIPPGRYLVLSVADSGAPLTSEEMEKMFEPFYKFERLRRSESNLGMALLRRMVKTHDGYIRIDRDASGLTAFNICFPVVADIVPSGKLVPAVFKGDVNVLVVDDMKIQRDVARQVLSSLGCRVFLASTGHEAVAMVRERLLNQFAGQAFAEKKNAFDVILLDMILEDDFDGLDTYKAIRAICPEQPCLIVSGFARSDRVAIAENLGIREFIRKPYTWDVLRDAIRRAMQ